MNDLFRGTHIHLTAEEPALRASAESRWSRNTAYHRLLDTDPQSLYSPKGPEKWWEKEIEKAAQGGLPEGFFFNIRTLPDEKLVGFVVLWGLEWTHGEATVSIALGEPEYWGKGLGTEAMRIILRYAFTELNLHRVTLWVFGYNQRAIRSYEKAGFRLEGRTRGDVQRAGKRHDSLWMGILREEWFAMQKGRKQ